MEGLAVVGVGAGCGSAWVRSSWRSTEAKSRRVWRDGVVYVVTMEEEEQGAERERDGI